MRITEFATNLFIKFAPVSQEAMSTLNVELSNYYTKILSSMQTKTVENEELAAKANKLNEEIKNLPEGAEKEAKFFELDKLHDQMVRPTVLERVVDFLDKPLVRVLLLISFAFVARYLTKKFMSPVTPEKDEPEDVQETYLNNQPQQQFHAQQYYHQQQPPYYPPYYNQFNGGYPPQSQSRK